MGKLDGRAAIVTGGTDGIGFAIVERLLADGAKVLFCGRTQARGDEALTRLASDQAHFLVTDVGEEGDVEALIARGVELFGGLDVLVNNAAVAAVALIHEHSTEDWRRSNAVNYDSVFFASRAAIPHLQKTRGTIINIASISGLGGEGAYPSYSAQKGAVIQLTRAMAVYHAREGIRINAICPGFVETPATDAFKALPDLLDRWIKEIPAQRAGRPAEIANLASFLASDEASFLFGAIVVADGGVSAGSGQPTQVPLG